LHQAFLVYQGFTGFAGGKRRIGLPWCICGDGPAWGARAALQRGRGHRSGCRVQRNGKGGGNISAGALLAPQGKQGLND